MRYSVLLFFYVCDRQLRIRLFLYEFIKVCIHFLLFALDFINLFLLKLFTWNLLISSYICLW